MRGSVNCNTELLSVIMLLALLYLGRHGSWGCKEDFWGIDWGSSRFTQISYSAHTVYRPARGWIEWMVRRAGLSTARWAVGCLANVDRRSFGQHLILSIGGELVLPRKGSLSQELG